MSPFQLSLRVFPGARRNEIIGVVAGELHVRVAAPPVDGKANRALRELLAGILGVPPSSISVIRGERSRHKIVEVAGITPEDGRARLQE